MEKGLKGDSMIEESRVFKLSPTTTIQDLGDGEGAVILELDTGQLHTCNDTTATFLAHVDGSRTFADLVDAAVNSGGKIKVGGKVPDVSGAFYPATVLSVEKTNESVEPSVGKPPPSRQ